MLLPPILQGAMPGWPVAPDPGPLDILVLALLIPGLITVIGVGAGMAKRWLASDAGRPAVAVPDGHAEILPPVEALEARRELVHQAAVRNEGRPDRPLRPTKNDPETLHP